MITQIQYDNKGYTLGSPGVLWTEIAFNNSYVFYYESNAFIVHKRTAGASESTYTWSGGANHYAGMSFVVAVSGATAIDVVGDIAFPFSRTAPSVTTTTSTDLLIYAVANSDEQSFVGPSGMTQRANDTPTVAYFRTSISTETLTAIGATGTRTATTSPVILDDSNGFTSLLIAVK